MNKDILNKKERLEKSKTLTNDFIEKLDKCKTKEELRVFFFEVDLKPQDFTGKDVEILIGKVFEKQDKVSGIDLRVLFNLHIEKQKESKTLTKDFIEKINKSKTNEELKVVYNEIVFLYQDLTSMDLGISIIQYNEKQEKLLKKSKTLTNNFIEKIDKSKDILELLDVIDKINSKYQDLNEDDIDILFKNLINKELE